MSKQINYGWLNDYSGKVFAPITVSSAVLVNLAKDGNGATTTMPLDKFLATQFITTRNYLDTQLVVLDEKVNELRRHVYYMEEDSWSEGNSQGSQSNPKNDKDGNVITDHAISKSKTIQSQINDVRDRLYDKESNTLYNNITGRNDRNTSQDKGKTEAQQSAAKTLQSQLYAQKADIYNLKCYVRSIVTDDALTNYQLKDCAEDYSPEDVTVTVKVADHLSTDITVNSQTSDLKEDSGKTVYDTNNNLTQVTSNSKNIGKVVGKILTSAPDKDNTASESTLSLAEHLGSDTADASSYQGWMLSVKNNGLDTDTSGNVVYLKRFKFNKQGLLEQIDSGSNSTALQMGVAPYDVEPAEVPTGYEYPLLCCNKDATKTYYTSVNSTTGIYLDYIESTPVLMGAAWNDYAEYRSQNEIVEPGYCVTPNRNGAVQKTNKRLQYCDGIVSDTFGFSIGKSATCQTPLAVSGRVLAHPAEPIESYEIGDPVCASFDGKISKMTREEVREYPDRIVGTVSEIPEYEEWNGVKINNRIWIKVK